MISANDPAVLCPASSTGKHYATMDRVLAYGESPVVTCQVCGCLVTIKGGLWARFQERRKELLPPYLRCNGFGNTTSTFDHVALEHKIAFRDGRYHARCYFCGLLLQAARDTDPWIPLTTPYRIHEELDIAELIW